MAYFEIAIMNTGFVGCSFAEIPLWYQVPVGHFFSQFIYSTVFTKNL